MIASTIRKTAIAAVLILSAAVVPAAADDMAVCAKASDDSSIGACSRIIDTGGRDLSLAYYSRGLARYKRGDYDLVISDENEAIRRKPDFAFAYQVRGLAYYAKQDLDPAIADYTQAIKIDPKYATAFMSRGNAYSTKQDYDHAFADINEAIRIKPDYPDAIFSRGIAYSRKGDIERAIVDYGETIRLNPKDVRPYRSRAAALLNKDQFDRAIADFTESIRLDPADAISYRERGVAYRESGNLESALADFNESIRRNPNHAMAYTARGILYEKRGDKVRARQDFEAAVALPVTTDPVAVDGARYAALRLGALSTTTVTAATTTATASLMAVSSSSNDRRVALVIGNSAHKNAPSLPNPQRDATLVANTLKKIGFTTVTLQTDLTRDALVSALRAFAQTAETADWAVVYYAGHGMEVGGTNYLVPVDARIAADRDIAFEAVPLDQVINAAERAKKLRLVILDACRDNPLANQMKRTLTVASRSVSQGLAAVEPEAGTLVVYAAKDGETALDGDGANSPFASAFVKNLQTPNLEVRRLFDFVRDDVMDVTTRKQKPFSYGSISGRQDFYFVAAK